MNILIIAAARSGGRYLMESLAKTYNLNTWHEPRINILNLKQKFPNIVIKVLFSHDTTYQIPLSKCLELGSKFDHIIILNRKLTTEFLESKYALRYITKNIYVKYNYEVSLKKHIDTFETKEDYEKHHESYSTRLTNHKKIMDKRLHEIASLFNQKVVMYDELYYNPNKIDYLNGLEFNPDLNYKLRTDDINKNKTLI
jgi:hypothetical protein